VSGKILIAYKAKKKTKNLNMFIKKDIK